MPLFKKIVLFSFLLQLLWQHGMTQVTPPAAYGTSTKVNYVREWSALAPIQDSAQMVTRPVSDVQQTTNYFDGLGRPLQTVQKQFTPLGRDLVKAQVYDSFGREAYIYLPFGATAVSSNDLPNDGNFKLDPFQEQASFSSGQYPGQTYYYGQNAFEASPLDRALTNYSVGNSWVGGGRGETHQYLVNTTTDSVRIWTISAAPGSIPATTGYYTAGALYKNTTADEAGHTVIQYKDMLGKLIQSKVQLWNTPSGGPSGWLNTYYVYDDLDNLRFVIQPKAVEWLLANSWNFGNSGGTTVANELCFRYEYDARRHMIIKKIPGAGETWLVYDARDRVVMTQDSVLRSQHKWLFTRYDGMNRPDSTGLITDPTNYNNLNYHLTQASTSSNYPVVSSYTNQLMTQTYYDNYSWAAGSPSGVALSNTSQPKLISTYNTAPDYAVAPTAYMITRGLSTGMKTKALDTSSTFLTSLIYYDDRGRVVQIQKTNYTGATDTLTTQYNFSGQSVRTLLNHQKANHTAQHHDVLTRISFDAGQRVKAIWKNVDGMANDQLIDSLQYNELGQVRAKFLTGGIDSLVYDYNIRGWITGINKKYVGGGMTHYFGQELGYDSAASVTGTAYTVRQYNGNIAGLTWKTFGDSSKRRYDFTYDNVNRLSTANFQQNTGGGWSNSLVNYSVNGLNYDANGNIMAMTQYGFKWNGSSAIDSLLYKYLPNSNKLYLVGDSANDTQSKLGDFHYSGIPDTAYRYDGNGNLIADKNKAIDSITYNYLNLPQKVHLNGKGNILYTYDAAGNKLTKVTIDSLSRHATTTLYLGGFVYQRTDTITPPSTGTDTLQFLLHEEGRLRWALHYYVSAPAKYGWEWDTYEKDHQGNTRMVLTTQKDTGFYAATMEAAYRAKENALFYNIPQTAYSRTLAGYPVDTSRTNPNDSVIMLNGTTGRTQGPAIILKIMAGDTLSVFVNSYYTSHSGTGTNPSITDALTSLANGIVSVTGGGKGTFSQLDNTSSPLYGALTSLINKKDSTVSGKPRAYLNYMFLDDQYKYDSLKSGALAVGNTTAGVINPLSTSGIVAAKNGFLYVYVSNETQGWPVYFDYLSVQVRSGPVLEETHYYPFGLTMAGISDKALKSNYSQNKFKYNGKELQNGEFSDGSGLEEYDYGARMYDPQIGRWNVMDNKAEKYLSMTPYAYGANDPLRFNDPGGDTLSPNGTAQEVARINRALAIVAITNPDEYNALQGANVNIPINIVDKIPPPEHDLSTGDHSRVPFESKPDQTDLKGVFSSAFKTFFGIRDEDPSNPGTKFSKLEGNGDDAKRVPITVEEANKLVKLLKPNIEVDRSLTDKDFARVLAHELGHGAFALINGAVANFRPGPADAKGHDKGNPSGEAADKAEKRYNDWYKRALQILKEGEANSLKHIDFQATHQW